jgi:uncharacterized protein (DUF2267 family)
MKKGMPLAEAQAKAAELHQQIRGLLKSSPPAQKGQP